jgi:hypothetical protein
LLDIPLLVGGGDKNLKLHKRGDLDRNWKNTIKISGKDTTVVSMSVPFRVPCARWTCRGHENEEDTIMNYTVIMP